MKSAFRIDPKYIAANPHDNVATAIQNLVKDTPIDPAVSGEGFKLRERIPSGHKFALKDIAVGGDIVKYGEVIGSARSGILRGEHVHVHNVTSSYDGGWNR